MERPGQRRRIELPPLDKPSLVFRIVERAHALGIHRAIGVIDQRLGEIDEAGLRCVRRHRRAVIVEPRRNVLGEEEKLALRQRRASPRAAPRRHLQEQSSFHPPLSQAISSKAASPDSRTSAISSRRSTNSISVSAVPVAQRLGGKLQASPEFRQMLLAREASRRIGQHDVAVASALPCRRSAR